MTSVITGGEGSVSIDDLTLRHCCVQAAGAFDLSNRDILGVAILAALENDPEQVEVDFAEVRFIDAGVIRTLMSCREVLETRGCVLRIVGAVGVAAMVFDLTRTRVELCGDRPVDRFTRPGPGRPDRGSPVVR